MYKVFLVCKEFPEDIVAESVEYVFVSVVHIGLDLHEIQHLPSFVDDEVQFETKIPSHGALPHNSIVPEHLVASDTLVMADGDAGAVNKTYSCAIIFPMYVYEKA